MIKLHLSNVSPSFIEKLSVREFFISIKDMHLTVRELNHCKIRSMVV